ncbi:prosolanapyrone synthase [Colletotrichum spaethianum]|uniref:Prosolanapyrone synthase n=1 Tax=Colletotrichum spaethianum TaxID=700344 RepID=A0AA37PE76_9PEZI|nr:prosolanapyrone synthase [Colletotrichum spaethianum]GKT50532.1 prosolanapyrone synthase [Colletotrichum spaethianum]
MAVDLKGGALAVVTKNTPWPVGKAKRVSVNSSGYGGANGHVVIDGVDEYFKSVGVSSPFNKEPDVDPYSTITQKKFLLPVTAHDEYSMSKSLVNMNQVLNSQIHDIHELLYTMVARRTRFSHRAMIPVEISREKEVAIGEAVTGRATDRAPIVAFVFTGQGAQWPEMGRQLMDSYPSVRKTFKKLNLALSNLEQRPQWTLEEILLEPEETSRVGEVSFSQPICTAIQISIVNLLWDWGVKPEAVIGHSSGELAAAYAAGLITAEDAITAAYLRGVHAMLTQAPGTMMAVALGAKDAQNLLYENNIASSDVVVACVNSPESVTLSGKPKPMDALHKLLKQGSILCKKLQTGGKAYHSPSMKEVGSHYSKAILEATARFSNSAVDLKSGKHKEPKPVMVSSVTVTQLHQGDIDGNYWQKNLESPVLFDPALKHMLGLKFGSDERFVDCLIEIGPHSALKGPIKQIISSPEVQEIWKSSLGVAPKVTYEQTLERGHDAEDDMIRLSTSLFLKGYPLDLLLVNGHTAYRPSKVIIDLPKYPWNHETPQPLIVNRATQDYKFATHPRHDLIGSRLPGGNRMEPIWRNYLRLEDVPWIKDHVIGSAFIIPGAAYLAMAVEAAAQFAEDTALGGPPFDFEDSKFHLHTVTIKSALVLPASGTTDIMTNLRPTEASAASNRFEFKICSVTDGQWIEHAQGIVSFEPVHGAKTKKVPFNKETEEPTFEQTFGKEAWYERLRYRGFDFGPLFRVIDEIEVLPHASRARARAPILKTAEMTTPYESRYAIHPLTIDAVLQGRVASVYTSRADKEAATQIPVFIEEMTISPSTWAKNQTGFIDSVAWTEGARSGGSHSTLTTESGFEIISARNVKWRQFENQGSQEKMNKEAAREPYYRMQWKPDVDFMDTDGAHRLFHSDFHSPSGAAYLDEVYSIRTRLETVTILYICGALEMVRLDELSTDPSLKWIHGFYNWMCHVRNEAAAGRMTLCEQYATSLDPQQREQRIKQLLSELPGDFPQLEFNAIVYQNMVGILNGTVAGIDLAVKAEILARVYADGSIHDAARKNLASVIDILAHKNPTMRVLEVGAGTGSCTSIALDVLNAFDRDMPGHHAKRYHDYTFTDISPAFFEKAEELFSAYPPMIYKTFNLSVDAAAQGFELGEYDLILASNVMHAPANTDQLLLNCSRLLKPGGRLVMLEITQTGSLTPVQFAFGTLPSFWECLEDADADRSLGPFRTLPSWEQQLKISGFAGLDMVLTDFPEPLALESVMVASTIGGALNRVAALGVERVVIVHSSLQNALGKAVEEEIMRQGVLDKDTILHYSLDSISHLNLLNGPKSTYIVLEEIQTPVLKDMLPEQFEGLKKLVSSATSILWVTGGDLMAGTNPALAMAHGINTVLMNENSAHNLKFATLDIDNTSDIKTPLIAKTVVKVWTTVATAVSRATCETDFILKDENIYISRVSPDMQLNEEFSLDTGPGRTGQAFPNFGNIQLSLETPGLLDTVYFREKPTCEIALNADEVEIEVKAVGLNMKDYVIAMGNFESVKSSNESTGIVSRVGANVAHLKPGDKVICLERGHYDTFLRSPAQKCLKLDDDADLIEMATVGIAHGTALYALDYLAHLEAGETVLIQAATGGLGLAAIQYAKYVGAEVYATVGTQQKRDYLISKCGIPDDHIFHSRTLQFRDDLLKQTRGRGVDVILSAISGPGFHESLKCLAPCGKFIDVGRGNVLDKGNIGLHAFDRSISFFSFDLNFVLEEKPRIAARESLLSDAMKLLRDGKIKPIKLDRTFHITEMEMALRYFGQGQHIGKIVLTYGTTPNRIKIKGALQPHGIDGNNSYLMVGCHGGLGHSMADSIIERGAKNLVFLGRSSENKPDIASFCRRARGQGVNVVTIQGDVSKIEDVKRAVAQAISMGPLKGVVHAAMVLQDAFFDSMTLEQFNTAVRPKVHGALNLHNATISVNAALDFFFMTSSTVTYVGHISQANYAASNAVLNNLSRQRIRMGLPSTTISLGPIKGVGTLNRKPEYAENLLRSGLIEAEESEFIRHFERFTYPQPESKHFDSLTQGHILTGVEYSKHDVSMVQVTRIEQDRRSALLVTTLESRKAAGSGGAAAADASGDDLLLVAAVQRLLMPAAMICCSPIFQTTVTRLSSCWQTPSRSGWPS